MTANEKQTLREDIAFMRALADEGVSAPLLAGPWLMFAGINFAVASIVTWAGYAFFHPPAWLPAVAYFSAFLLMMVFLPLKLKSQSRRAGYNAPANKATGMAWAGIGWGIFAFCASVSVACWKLNTALPTAMIPAAVLVLYGSGWTVAAAMSRQKFLWWPALGSYVSAIAISVFLNTPHLFLIYAVILILIAFVPGYVLWKREPKDIV